MFFTPDTATSVKLLGSNVDVAVHVVMCNISCEIHLRTAMLLKVGMKNYLGNHAGLLKYAKSII